jgi:hypothetical protein
MLSRGRAEVDRRDLAVILGAGGLVLASIGGATLGQGIAIERRGTCPAWPMTTEGCESESTGLKIAGGTVLGVGLTVSLAGLVLAITKRARPRVSTASR